MKKLKTISQNIGGMKFKDIIIIENLKGGMSKIKKIFCSMSRGIVKYETIKGKIWELKIK